MRILIGLWFATALAFAQTGGLNIVNGTINFSGATHTSTIKTGTSNPATCTTGEVLVRTDATAGQNLYFCTATNTWTQQLNSGSATGGGITVYSGTGLTVTANTYYFPPGGGGTPSTTETNVDIDSPSAATVTNFFAQLSVALGAGNTGVFTWRKNGVDTSVTCTITGASATSCSDTTHSFSVSQGDLLTIKLVTTGTIIVTPNVMMAAQFGNITATGTVNSGTAGNCTYYAASGSAVSGQGCASESILGQIKVETFESTTSTTFVDLTTPDTVTFTLPTGGGSVLVSFSARILIGNSGALSCDTINIDGVNITSTGSNDWTSIQAAVGSQQLQISFLYRTNSLAAGSHTIKIQHRISAGTGSWLNRQTVISYSL